jgi:polysaccharide pyruvyl transferase WcaK-like protein
MRVLIYGVNSKNKGSQLLLAATARRLVEWGHQPVVALRDVDARTRKESAAVGMFAVERLRALRSAGLDRLPRQLDRLIPVAADGHFDYVLDASGFSLTDAWGMAPVNSRLSRLERWRKRGIGYTMLPQAFGPFTRPDVADGVRKVVDYADAVWARDETSRAHVQGLEASSPIDIAPDITIPLAVASRSGQAEDAIIIVPNWNLARRADPSAGSSYVQSLTATANALLADGHRVVGMSHEGARDLDLIQQVAAGAPEMQVISPRSGIECKEIIAGSKLVVAGRYHALVSALSSGVPAIGHSWSHKYAALMNDFSVADGLADPLASKDTIGRVAALDLTAERSRLRAVHDTVVKRVDAVWAQLAKTLERA